MTEAPESVRCESVRCGLIIHDDSRAAERLLAGFIADLRRLPQAPRLGGVYQITDESTATACQMEMVEIDTNTPIPLSQSLGRDSQSCRLDPDGMARAAMAVRRAIAARVDLVVLNKIAKQECEGRGLAAELLDALAEDLPVLVPIHRRHLPCWRTLTGGQDCDAPDPGPVGTPLAPDPAALWRWVRDLGLVADPPPPETLAARPVGEMA